MAAGEPYYYQCWAGLLFITIPIAPQNRCTGGIAIGGFHTPEQQQDIRDTITQTLGTWTTIDTKPLLSKLNSLRPITTSALRGLGHLAMESTFSCGLNSSDFFRAQNEKYLQRRRIAEAFSDIRSQVISEPDILSDAYQLVSILKEDNKTKGMEFVSLYLAKLLLASNWDLIKLKAHIRTLLAVVTSHRILKGIPWAVAVSHELRDMAKLEQATTTEESCYVVADWFQHHFHRQEQFQPDGRSLADRVLAWIYTHYQEPITLSVAAKANNVSSSTLAHRLPIETGKTFKQLLRDRRLAESKKLLATSALDISAISTTCGFFDQSHFTREFKRAVNLTPGQFRKLLAVPKMALQEPNAKCIDDNQYSNRINRTPRGIS
jgi:AraC-like DNA-binding protein